MQKTVIEITGLEEVKAGYVVTEKKSQSRHFLSRRVVSPADFYPGKVVIPLWLANKLKGLPAASLAGNHQQSSIENQQSKEANHATNI